MQTHIEAMTPREEPLYNERITDRLKIVKDNRKWLASLDTNARAHAHPEIEAALVGLTDAVLDSLMDNGEPSFDESVHLLRSNGVRVDALPRAAYTPLIDYFCRNPQLQFENGERALGLRPRLYLTAAHGLHATAESAPFVVVPWLVMDAVFEDDPEGAEDIVSYAVDAAPDGSVVLRPDSQDVSLKGPRRIQLDGSLALNARDDT